MTPYFTHPQLGSVRLVALGGMGFGLQKMKADLSLNNVQPLSASEEEALQPVTGRARMLAAFQKQSAGLAVKGVQSAGPETLAANGPERKATLPGSDISVQAGKALASARAWNKAVAGFEKQNAERTDREAAG